MENVSDINLYDYIELKVYDIHGYKRGRIITRSQLPSVFKHGMGLRHGKFINHTLIYSLLISGFH